MDGTEQTMGWDGADNGIERVINAMEQVLDGVEGYDLANDGMD